MADIWARPWENLFMTYANNKGAIQPAHPRSIISAFVVRCLDSIIPLVSISKISSLLLAAVAAQAGLCFTWSKTPKTGFLVTRLISYPEKRRLYVTTHEAKNFMKLCVTQTMSDRKFEYIFRFGFGLISVLRPFNIF